MLQNKREPLHNLPSVLYHAHYLPRLRLGLILHWPSHMSAPQEEVSPQARPPRAFGCQHCEAGALAPHPPPALLLQGQQHRVQTIPWTLELVHCSTNALVQH